MVAADVTDLECCYKGTFICVQEKTPTMKRTQSLPDMLDVLPASRPDKYVAHLEQRANALSFLPLETDATTPEEKPSVPQGEQTPKGLEEPPSGVVAESEPTGACAGGMPPACASLGSLGHPEFCRKPCLFLYYGECPKGDQCEYCHYTHGQHAKLDKRQREALHSLSEADLLGLLLPHLRARTEKMQPNAAEEVLGLMEKHLAFLPKQKSGWLPPWKFTQLNRLLCQMSFLRLFRLCPCSDVPEIKQAMEALREVQLPDGHQLRVNSEGYAWLRFAQCRGALFGSWGTFAVGLSDVRGLISTHFDQWSQLGEQPNSAEKPPAGVIGSTCIWANCILSQDRP